MVPTRCVGTQPGTLRVPNRRRGSDFVPIYALQGTQRVGTIIL
jgi:hypothetical protein